MKNMEKIARAYRLPEISTPENLACAWSCTADFGTRFLVAGYFYASEGPCYYGAVYDPLPDAFVRLRSAENPDHRVAVLAVQQRAKIGRAHV